MSIVDRVRRLWLEAKQHYVRLLWGCCLLLLTNITTMAIPQVLRLAVDSIAHVADLRDLVALAKMLIYLALAGAVFRTLSRIHILYVARDIEKSLRCDFYSHLTTLDPGFYQHHPAGDLMSRATNDLGQVRLMLGPGILNSVNTAIAYAASLPLMLMISVKLTLIACCVYPAAIILMRHMGKRLYQCNREQQITLGVLSNFIQENLSGGALVRAFAIEQEQQARFQTLNGDYYTKNVNLAFIRSGMFRVSATCAAAGTLLAVYVGATDVMVGRLSVGDIVALVEYMALLSWPTFALGWVLSLWQRGAASMQRLDDIFCIAPVANPPALLPASCAGLEPRLQVQALSVSYRTNEHVITALKHVSFDVAAGQTIGVVGLIGSGKSTLLRTLLRLVEIEEGDIVVGGVPLRTLPMDILRHMFGYVPQTPNLFSKSIRDNIAFGSPQASLDDITRMADVAHLTPDLAMFPNGLDTEVGERGITLSGGQKQRIAIARALLLAPPILLLDDALSAVDNATQVAILNNLKHMRAGLTTIVVTHRLSVTQHADMIVVLEKGRLRAANTHAVLMVEDKGYATMFHRQALATRLGEA